MTCRGCRHEFWWCCGQAYRGKHNEFLCAPGTAIGFIAHHPSPYWGPNVPVRAITKVTASCVGLGLGVTAAAVSAVAVPLYLGGRALSDKSGFKDWRRNRRQRHRAAVQRAAIERHVRRAALIRADQEQRRSQDDLRLAQNLQDGFQAGGFHEDIVISYEDVLSLEALPAFTTSKPCALCSSRGFRRPRDLLHHMTLHTSRALSLSEAGLNSGVAVEALRFEMLQMRAASGCVVFAALSPVAVSSADTAAAERELAELHLRHFGGRRYRGTRPETTDAGQRCQCGVEPPSLQAWCAHLAVRNPKQSAQVVRAPAACGVIVRPGVLCPCRACEAPGVVCVGCFHPRMLHFNTARGNPQPTAEKEND